jgi:Tol biopolymer transport system component
MVIDSTVGFAFDPSGREIVFVGRRADGQSQLFRRRLDQEEAVAIAGTEGAARAPSFSPDGRWLAYASNESGRLQVYFRAFPGPGGKRTVSTGGGADPRWRADGREIYFNRGDAVLAADVTPLGPRPARARRFGPVR